MSSSPRRAHGTGSLEIRTDKYGREIYYGRFYVGGRQVKRTLGPKRRAGESTGLTKTGAERALQKLIDAEVRVVPPSRYRVRPKQATIPRTGSHESTSRDATHRLRGQS